MTHDTHHVHLVKELTEQLEPIFSKSPQAIYLYLDDAHKSCNKKFSDLLGYKSPEEWAASESPVSDVAESDQQKVISAYMDASKNYKASTIHATVVRKDGEKLHTELIMVPITYKNEVFVLHFISPKK